MKKEIYQNSMKPMSDDGGSGSGIVTLDIETIDQKDFPTGNPDTSMNNSYCLATCFLAVARYYNPGKGVTMNRLEQEGIVNRGDGHIITWNHAYFDADAKQAYSASKVRAALAKKKPVILVGESHYVVAYGYRDTDILVMDPWNGVKGVLGKTTLKKAIGYRVCNAK